MATYLTVDTFRYEEIKFDFTNDGQVDKHDNKMARFVRDVQKWVRIIFYTNISTNLFL